MSSETIIELTGIVKNYESPQGQVCVISGVDLKVMAGEFVALVGVSGSGKTTLLNILGCLDVPSEGSYMLGGQDVSCLSENNLAAIRNLRIGFVFQAFNLIPRISILRNVMLPMIYARTPRELRSERARTALAKVGLGKFTHHTPHQLSGGQRQRVAVARALVTNPMILLADEPTGNLDTEATKNVLALFEDLHTEGHTILIVTHDREVAAHCTRRIEILDGKLFEKTELGE